MQEQIDTFRIETENVLKAAENQRKLEYVSRMDTLLAELEVNLSICTNELIANYEKHKDSESLPVPESRFSYSMMEKTLSSGEVFENKARLNLWASFRYMQTVNSLLSQALTIMHTEHIADPRDLMLISGRRSKTKSLIINSAKYLHELQKTLVESIKLIQKMKNT